MCFYGFIGVGFKAVEWGAEIPDQYSLQELVAAREKAGVSVIGLCTPAGMLFVTVLICTGGLYLYATSLVQIMSHMKQ